MAQQQENTDQQEESLHISQSMIDVYSQRLIGLRTQCATSAELTQQEIRSLEGKLIKMFSSQLAVKAELKRTNGTGDVLSKYDRIPNLEQWLQVVGLRAESVKAVCARVKSLEELQERKCWEEELKPLLGKRQEELQRLCRALDNLRRYTAMVRDGAIIGTLGMDGNDGGSNMCLLDCGMQQLTTTTLTDSDDHSHSGSTNSICIPPLYWDSWDRRRDTTACTSTGQSLSSSSPRPSRPRPAYRASIPNEESHHLGGLHHHHGVAGDDSDVIVPVASSPGACVAAPMLVVSPTSATVLSPVACHDGVLAKTPVLESVSIPLQCNGGAISASVSSNALYYASNVKIPACPVSPTFNISRKPPGLTNCRTPPACRKNTCLPSATAASVLPPLCGTPTSLEFPSNLTKSKSHESQLANDQQPPPSSPVDYNTLTNSTSNNNDNNNQFISDRSTTGQVAILASPLLRRERLPTEPGPEYGSNYDVTQLLDVQQLHHQHQSFIEQNYNGGCRQVQLNVVPGDVMCGVGITAAVPLAGGTKGVSQTAPASPRVLRHRIAHRFQKTFKMMASCAVCLKPIYFGTGLRCKECKYRCHRDCEDSAVPSCGLTPELLKAVGAQFQDGFGNTVIGPGNCLPNRRKNSAPPSQIGGALQGYQPPLKDHQFSGGGGGFISNLLYNKHKFHNHHHHQSPPPPQQSHGSQSHSPQLLPGTKHHSSSSTTSSCNSSAPSSPAPPHVHTLNVGIGVSSAAVAGATVHATRSSFHFPDSVAGGNTTTLLDHLQKDRTNSSSDQQQSAINNHHEHGTTDHEPPPPSSLPPPTPTRVDSQDSQVSSDTETLIDGATGAMVTGSAATNSSAGNQRQNSMTTALKEWDIPFGELVLEGPGPLGSGRFGTVWRGQWHGDVAIKVLHGQDEARTLHQFRSDVSTFRKTRHENLVLFMGACTRPPHLAIVTSLCKGQTLHALVHQRRERFSLARAAAIAQQISQGMGYLHAKGILHKDLTSKNVFLENQGTKVVITDFGLFSGLREMMGDSTGSRLAVPPGWLCYLAPELVRALTPTPPPPSVPSMCGRGATALPQQLPFSRAADVFAFGTIWFELLCGDWPFRGEPAEAVIWQVGAGRKVSLTNLHATKDVKDVLMACWAYKPTDREDFASLLERLRRLPTAKRLARSPSHPVHLSRSAESVF